jgi:hypothetical protein
MSKVTPEEMYELLAKAATSIKARDGLLNNPMEFAHQKGVELDDDDIEGLKKLRRDLKRFGGQRKLNKTDAKSWAIGVCQIRTPFKP